MAKYQKYAEYKDSGVEWLGAIPGHWGVTQLKRLGKFITGMTPSTAVEAYYSDEITEYGWIRPEDILEESEKVEPTKFLTKLGWETQRTIPAQSTLICCIGTIGKLGFLGKRAVTNQQITALVPDVRGFSKYYYYLLTASRNQLEHLATGNVVKILNSERLGSLWLPLLSSQNEARQIVHFLDHETTKIDHLIEKQHQLIELLKEKRQAVISHAVTKGLNPNVPMKDSGVAWLGEVPEHWEVTRFAYQIFYQEGPGILAVDFHETGIPLLRIQNVKSDFVSNDYKTYLLPSKVLSKWDHYRVEKGDLIISCSASTGLVSEVDESTVGAIPYTGLIRLKPRTRKIISQYIKLLVQSDLFFEQIEVLQTGSTIQHFGPFHLQQMYISLPPNEEQEVICLEVKNRVRDIENLILKAESAIQLMQERRIALISAAVTGKIDVRNWQAPTLAEAQTELSA